MLLMDNLPTLFLYYRNYHLHFMSHFNTIIPMFLVNISQCKNTEKCLSECDLNLLPNVTSKTLEKKKSLLMASKQLATFWKRRKKKKSPNSTVKCHNMLSEKASTVLIAPFLCIAMPPAGVKDPLFLHSIFVSPLSRASHLRNTTSKPLANCKTLLDSQNKHIK